MAVFVEYEIIKAKLRRAEMTYSGIINERDAIFQRTQPKSTDPAGERVTGGGGGDVYAEYLAEKTRRRIDERLEEAIKAMADNSKLRWMKEKELRDSNDTMDRVYTMTYIDNLKISRIARDLNYSKSQIYRILKKIEKRCDKMRQNAKMDVL